MVKRSHIRNNILIALALAVLMLACASFTSSALSAPNAEGRINSSSGAYLRKSSSTGSKKVALLSNGTQLTIYKEIFKKKTSTSSKNRWYYVSANGRKGYVRADLVGSISYGSVKGVIKAKVNYRKGAGTKMKKGGSFGKNSVVTVCLAAKPVSSTKGSSSTWYKIQAGQAFYYLCSSKVKLTGKAVEPSSNKKNEKSGTGNDAAPAADTAPIATPSNGAYLSDSEFETYMSRQGFPESYKTKLRTLHKAHPNWGFESYMVNVSWSTALSKETKSGVSLINKSYPESYRSGSKQVESGWYNASSTVVEYYMDPRNFLTEDRVYMFEDLSYKPAYQTVSVVNAILAPSKLPENGFTGQMFVDAGAKCNTSPVFLAARARQETGGGSNAITGNTSLGKVYNCFNIGAFGGTDPLYNGLVYALAKGWTTPQKAVEGGAAEIAKNYINKGQDTLYYQRFNVKNGSGSIGTHQYMTNIMAAYSEALNTKKSYAKYGITNQPFVFSIPVYNSMPSSTKLP